MVKYAEADEAVTIQGDLISSDGSEDVENDLFQDVITDIEVHGKILKLLLSICKALDEDDLIDDDNQAMKRVAYLETVWHGVWLRTLEWECLIEQSLARGVVRAQVSG